MVTDHAAKLIKWQARRDLNPQHPDLESGALAIRATGLWSHQKTAILFPGALYGTGKTDNTSLILNDSAWFFYSLSLCNSAAGTPCRPK